MNEWRERGWQKLHLSAAFGATKSSLLRREASPAHCVHAASPPERVDPSHSPAMLIKSYSPDLTLSSSPPALSVCSPHSAFCNSLCYASHNCVCVCVLYCSIQSHTFCFRTSDFQFTRGSHIRIMSSDQDLDARAAAGETVVPGGTGGKSLEA